MTVNSTAAFVRGTSSSSLDNPATTEFYTLSLHDALPIWARFRRRAREAVSMLTSWMESALRLSSRLGRLKADRKSTRLNSSHITISYAVFCLKKKKDPRLELMAGGIGFGYFQGRRRDLGS